MVSEPTVFRIPNYTALLPKNFDASPEILLKLRVQPDISVKEYSSKVYSLFLRNTECIDPNTRIAPWMQANPIEKWSITFQSNEPIYGTEYWIDYEPEGLLEYLRKRTTQYDLIYKCDDIPIFTLHANQFHELGKWYVRINTIWHIEDQNLDNFPNIFYPHGQCAVCLEDAFLVRWRTCKHAFCQDCTTSWRRETNTCPLCRSRDIRDS
jgi:hypothetical protein